MADSALAGLTGLLDIVQRSGPVGALVASGIVGLALAVIVVANLRGLWTNSRAGDQSARFVSQCLALIADLRASEEALRKRVDELSHDRGMLLDEVEEFRVQLALLRHQRRRLVDMLRHVLATLPPAPSPAHSVGSGTQPPPPEPPYGAPRGRHD